MIFVEAVAILLKQYPNLDSTLEKFIIGFVVLLLNTIRNEFGLRCKIIATNVRF
jgi:hypothetical protein